jgi:hypothetical protein
MQMIIGASALMSGPVAHDRRRAPQTLDVDSLDHATLFHSLFFGLSVPFGTPVNFVQPQCMHKTLDDSVNEMSSLEREPESHSSDRGVTPNLRNPGRVPVLHLGNRGETYRTLED